MELLTFITKGDARIFPEGLRCAAPREDKTGKSFPCNKLLVKKASNGQIAGDYQCGRCGQHIEVILKPARADVLGRPGRQAKAS